MTMLIPLVWLALGMTVPLSGTVVDADGRPIPGATVWLGDTSGNRQGPDVLATATTDDQGRFRLDRADDLAGRGSQWSPTLWAYKPGRRVAFKVFMRSLPRADEPVRLVLGPPVSIALRVLQADGKPARGVTVRLVETNLKAPRPPDKLLDRLVATTDADGRATLDGFAPEEIPWLDVTVPGQIVQSLPMDPDTRIVQLRPLGRLMVRLVGDEPKALRGWTITARSRPTESGYQGPYLTHWVRQTTGDDGRAAFPSMAEGQVLWDIKAPEGSNDLMTNEPAATIRAGATESVEFVVRRGVRVEGTVRDAATGAPIPGVKVDVARTQLGSRMVFYIDTDAQGRFSRVVLPGQIEFSYSPTDVPKDYVLTPGSWGQIHFEVKDGEGRHECSPPPLRKAALVRGRVIDEAGRPFAGASVSGSMTSGEYASHPHTVWTETDARGEFVLGNIVPKSAVKVSASWRWAADAESSIVTRAGEGEPITVRLRKRPTLALSGRVLGNDGRPMAGALVRVLIRPLEAQGSSGSEFAFEGSDEIRTGSDGRYQTPAQLPVGNAYRIAAETPGYEPGESRWVVEPSVAVPDLKLRRSVAPHPVAGRVVDSAGKPVAGAEVFQSGDGPRRTHDTTDADGRFRVPGIPDTPAFLFVAREGFHFLGRRVEPAERTVAFVLRRLDEPAPARLQPAAAPVSRDEERAIARALLAEARAGLGHDGGWLDCEASALVDPDRTIERIENQAIKAEPRRLAALALAWSEGQPRKALDLIDAIGPPDQAAFVGLTLIDRLGTTAPPAFRRELLDRIAQRAREIAEIAPAAQQLQGNPSPSEEVLDAIRAGIARRIQEIDETGWQVNEEPNQRPRTARRRACFRMAAKDLPAARALAAEDHDPMVEALLPAVAARARAVADPEGARALLREAVERLGKLGDGLAVRPSPAVAMARLLPMAARIDPDRAPDLLWRALSQRPTLLALHPPTPGIGGTFEHYLDSLELAMLVARYDRSAGQVVFTPMADRLVGLDDEVWRTWNERPALLKAAGAFDARTARTVLETWYADPGPTAKRQSKARACIDLARILGLSPALRLREPFLLDGSDWLVDLED